MIPIKSSMLTFVQKSDVNGGNRNVSTGINSKIGPLIHEQTMNWIKINRIQLAITVIGLLSFLCFLPSISNEFVFDDIPTIINNKDVCPEKTYFTKIFFNDFWGTPIVKVRFGQSSDQVTNLDSQSSLVSIKNTANLIFPLFLFPQLVFVFHRRFLYKLMNLPSLVN